MLNVSACFRGRVIRNSAFTSNLSNQIYPCCSSIWPQRWETNWGKKSISQSPRTFSALTGEEEEQEKKRVASLTAYQKEMELRNLDKELKRLNTLRGINTGELYTWRGKFKALTRDYGIGFLAWYWTTWTAMAGASYLAIEYGGLDAMAIIAKTDVYTGLDLAEKVDPRLGTVAVAIALNECLEPIRLVFVVSTTKPVVNMFSK